MAKTETLNVKRTELVTLFEKLDFKTASKWNKARLENKIASLPELVDNDTDAEDSQELLDSLLNAIENEVAIEITDDTAKTEDKKKTKKTKKTDDDDDDAPAPKKEKKEKKEKPSVEKDRFGSKIGTQCNLINEAMTGKPQDIKTIAEVSGMTISRVKAHMTYLVSKEFVEKTDKGYKVAATAPKK